MTKYISEFALNMHMTHDMLIQQEDLDKVGDMGYFDEYNPCHIYLICKRPRIILNPVDFKVGNGKILFPFQVQRQNKFENIYVEMEYNDNPDIVLTSEYPHTFYYLKKSNGELLQEGKAALLFQSLHRQYSSIIDLEVLYVGQSYGVEGARTAPDRLKSHSTLQGIYSEAISKNPDSEIWLLLTSFDQILLTMMDGRVKASPEERAMDTDHLKKVTKTVLVDGLNEQQVINFTEAALIRYFQPPYNIFYKDTFPNPAHKTYPQCYDLDINSICLELDTEGINCKLFSEVVDSCWLHMPKFFLHSRKERRDMFNFEKSFDDKNQKD